MAGYFLDSSAAAKLYVEEPGSSWIAELVNPTAAHRVHIVRITAAEVAAVLFRRVRADQLSADRAEAAIGALRLDLENLFQVVELSIPVSDLAITVAERHGLRGYDCVQLAAALTVRRLRSNAGLGPIQLVSADQELNTAARAEGLEVLDPNQYP